MNSDVFDAKHRSKTEYATKKEEETKARILDVIKILHSRGTTYPNFKTFLAAVKEVSREKYNVGTGYDTLMKYKRYWANLVDHVTNESTTNTDKSTDNTNSSEKLIFFGGTKLQETTSTKNIPIQPSNKSIPHNASTSPNTSDIATLGRNLLEKNQQGSNVDEASDSTTKTPMSKISLPKSASDGRRWGGKSQNPDKPTADNQPTSHGEQSTQLGGQSHNRKRRTPQTQEQRKANYQKRVEAREAKKQAANVHQKYPETLLSLELRNKLEQLEIPLDPQLIKKLSESTQYTIDGALLRLQQVRHKVRNVKAFLMQALKDGFKPHEPKYSSINNRQLQPQNQSESRKNWDGKLKITTEFIKFWEEASKIPGFLQPGQERDKLPYHNNFYEPKLYINEKMAFPNSPNKSGWYLCDWKEAAEKHLPKLIKSSGSETNATTTQLTNNPTINNQEFMRFWSVAMQTPGFLRSGQTIQDLKIEDDGAIKVSISEEIATKFIGKDSRSDLTKKLLLKLDPDGVNWRQVEWKQAQSCLDEFLEF